MWTMAQKQDFLQRLAGSYRCDQWPSEEELRRLTELCREPRGDHQERALTLLLTPPLESAVHYLRWLLQRLPALFPRAQSMPLPLLELLLELRGSLAEFPGAQDSRRELRRLVEKLSPDGLDLLCSKPLPLRPYLHHLPVRSVVWLAGFRTFRGKRRWRLLRKYLLADQTEASWGRLTTRDLAFLWPKTARGRASKLHQRGYRRMANFLVCQPRPTDQRPATPASMPRASSWEGGGARLMSYWQALLRQQAEELFAMRELARQVSETTGRVVLSWHNATLAAAGGWAFETLSRQFPDRRLWHSYQQAVRVQAQAIAASDQAMPDASWSAQRLWELWERRLIVPKVKHALWESRFRSFMDPGLEALWQEDLQMVGGLLDEGTIEEIACARRSGWCGAVSPHQRMNLQEVLAWGEERQACWHWGLGCLAALIHEGQRLLDDGHLQQLVLPWIDKFFISSQRKEDLEFLPLMVDWLTRQSCRPLILFWDDTSHRQAPSFQLALKRFRDMGHAFAGIGIFSNRPETAERDQAEAFIGRHHQEYSLFALRPYSDHHHPADLRRLLENADYRFLQPENYDSSWKDNLCFLYAGTQVFPLLAVQTDAEPFAAWVKLRGQRYPFGAYLRRRLRQQVLGDNEPVEEYSELSSGYARWANLL